MTSAIETIGRFVRSVRMTVRPLESVKDAGAWTCGGVTGPGFGISLRHASSAFTDSAPVPGGTF